MRYPILGCLLAVLSTVSYAQITSLERLKTYVEVPREGFEHRITHVGGIDLGVQGCGQNLFKMTRHFESS